MALLNQTFDVNSLPAQQDYAPIPAGWYNASITKAEIRATKDKLGEYVAIRYDILGPQHQGRVVFGNINTKNKSSQAEEIGRQQLGSIMRAVGLNTLNDTDQLIGSTLQIKVGISEQAGYEPSNDVRGYKAIEGGAMPQAQQFAPESTNSAPKSAAPWAKK